MRCLALTLAVMMMAPLSARPAHLADEAAIAFRLGEPRESHLARVEEALSQPEAASAAGALGTSVSRLRTLAAGLNDRELERVAARLVAFQVTPPQQTPTQKGGRSLGTVIALIALVVVLIIVYNKGVKEEL